MTKLGILIHFWQNFPLTYTKFLPPKNRRYSVFFWKFILAITTSSRKEAISRPHSAHPAVRAVPRKGSATVSSFPPSPRCRLQNFTRTISKLVQIGIISIPGKCPFMVPEIFWPILANDAVFRRAWNFVRNFGPKMIFWTASLISF